MTQTLRESIDAVERRRDAAAAAMVRVAREVVELAPGDATIGDLHTEYCTHARAFAEASAEASVRAFEDASEADFMEACHEVTKAASNVDADTAETVRLSASADEPSLEDAWSLLASRLLHVVDERIAALRVEMREEMDARIAIPDYVDKPGE